MYILSEFDILLIEELIRVYRSKVTMYDSLIEKHVGGHFQDQYYQGFMNILTQKLDNSLINKAYCNLSVTNYKIPAIIAYLKRTFAINMNQYSFLTAETLIAHSIINRLRIKLMCSTNKDSNGILNSITIPKRAIAGNLYKQGMIKEFYYYIFMNDCIQNILNEKNIEYFENILPFSTESDEAIQQEIKYIIDDLNDLSLVGLSMEEKKNILNEIMYYLKSFSFSNDSIIEYLNVLKLETVSHIEFIVKIGVVIDYTEHKIRSLI